MAKKNILIAFAILLFLSIAISPVFAAAVNANPKPDWIITGLRIVYDRGYYVLASVKNNGAAVRLDSFNNPLAVSVAIAGKKTLVSTHNSAYYESGYVQTFKLGPVEGIIEPVDIKCPGDSRCLTSQTISYQCPVGYYKISSWKEGAASGITCHKNGDTSLAITAAVDAWLKFSESNESNNVRKQTIRIPDKRPDFIMTNMRVTSQNGYNLYATFKNIGGFYIADTVAVPSLNLAAYIQGKKTIFTLNTQPEYPYDYSKEVLIGKINDINVKPTTFDCPGSSLCFDKPVYSGYSHSCPYGTKLLKAWGTGQGNDWTWKKTYNGCVATAGKNNIGTANCAITCEKPADQVLRIDGVVDAGSAFNESNERNNIKKASLRIPRPDFKVIDIFAKTEENSKTLFVKISNLGNDFDITQYPIQISVQHGGDIKTTTTSASDGVWKYGEVKTFQVGTFTDIFNAASTTAKFIAKVDSADLLPEFNENNNSLAKVVQLLPDFTVSKIWLRYNEDIEDYQYCLAVKNAGAGVDYVTEHEGFLSYANLNLRIMSLDKNADDSEDWLEVEGENEKLIFQSGAIREYCFGNTDNVAQQKSVALTATVWYYKPAGPYEQNIDNNSLTKTIAVPAKPVPGTAQ